MPEAWLSRVRGRIKLRNSNEQYGEAETSLLGIQGPLKGPKAFDISR